MVDTATPSLVIPDHAEETVRSIAELRATHHEAATPLQRALDRITAFFGRPRFVAVASAIVVGWISLNLVAGAMGHHPLDPPPFSWLGGAISLLSLLIAVLILTTQRREDRLAQHRELLMLELAILSEQKTAKIIQLLEESRRDNPLMRNRRDLEAEAMAQPSDPRLVLDVIKENHISTS